MQLRRRRLPALWFAIAAGLAFGGHRAVGQRAPEPPAPGALGEARLDLRELAPQVFLHTSFRDLERLGPFPSNGLLLCHPGDGGLVDTAWSEPATLRLIEEAAARGCPLKRALVTHSHDDRTAGIPVLLARGVEVLATRDTIKLLARADWKLTALAPPQGLTLGGFEIELFYPGPAHTADNVVVHVAAARLLFGGCMVKAASATSLGNVADAAIDGWPAAIDRLDERYRARTAIVVPGHGEPGDLGLVGHTRRLLREAPAAARR